MMRIQEVSNCRRIKDWKGWTGTCCQYQDITGKTNHPIAKLIPLEVSIPIATETDRPNSVAQKDTHGKGHSR